MAKKKINVKNVYLTEEDDILKIKGFEGEEIPFENLSEKIQEIINFKKPLDINIKLHSNRRSPQRKPVYKFRCSKCGKEIKTNDENPNLKCIDCDEILTKLDK